MISTLLAAGVGAMVAPWEWRRLARRHPGIALDTVLARARYLVMLIPAVVALFAMQAVVVAVPRILWAAPEWLEAVNGTRTVIVDPLAGRVGLTVDELYERWDGRAVECTRSQTRSATAPMSS